MSSFSDFLELELLDHVFGAATYTPPATLYFALFTAAPSDTGGGTEVSGNNYSRVAVTNNATNFPAAASGAKANGTAITFDTPSGSWGTVTHMGVYDASSSGNLLAWAPLSASQAVASGNVVSFPIGDFDVTLS
jgi:hypothetical protein